MRRRLNGKLLLWTVAALLGIGTVAYCWHGLQLQRNSGALLWQADRALEQGQLVQAVKYLNHYLSFEPGDTEALAKYGEVLDQTATTPQARRRALLVYDQVLRRESTRSDLRRRFIDVAIELRRFPDAIRHLEFLSAAFPTSAQWDHLLGCCLEAKGDYPLAVAAFQGAIVKAPGHLDSYVLLAELYQQRLHQPEEAAKALEDMTSANSRSVTACVYQARFHKKYGALPQAVNAMDRALTLAPTQPELLLFAAELALSQNQLDDARRHLQLAIQSPPPRPVHYTLLARLELEAGRPNDALRWLDEGIKVLPDAVELIAGRADTLLELGLAYRAEEAIARLRSLPKTGEFVEYLTARRRMLQGDWLEACARLAKVQFRRQTAADWSSRAAVALGRCYEELGETELRLEAFRRATILDPQSGAARLGLAEALLAAGRVEEALPVCRQLHGPAHLRPKTTLLLGRALLERNRRQPAQRRDWKGIDQLLAKAPEMPQDAAPLVILRVSELAAQNQEAEALRLLAEARRDEPEQSSLVIAQADLWGRIGNTAGAIHVLEQARKELGDSLSLRLALVQCWLRRGTVEAQSAVKQLAREPTEFSTTDELRWLRDLAEVFARLGDVHESNRCWQLVAQTNPRDLRSRSWLLQHALSSGHAESAERLLADIQRIEGPEGVLWRAGDVERLLRLARLGDRKQLQAARQRLAEILERRRDWAHAAYLQAQLDEIDGKNDRALDHYVRALELGARQPSQVRRITQLLVNHRRFFEAERSVRILTEQSPFDVELARLATEVALGNRDHARALARARQAVPAKTRDHRDLLWLAQIGWRAGQPKEAQQALERARQMAPRNPEVWVALVRHLVRTGRRSEAESLVETAHGELPADRLPWFLSGAYEALGQADRAEDIYRSLLREQPDDFLALAEFADFYHRADRFADAEPLWRRLVAPRTNAPATLVAQARRQLAYGLAQPATPAGQQQALALLDTNRQTWGKTVADERARAFVLATQPARRAQAMRLLDPTLMQQPLTQDEWFLLIQLYDSCDETTRAEELMQQLLGPQSDQPQLLAYHIRRLARRGDLAEAHRQLIHLRQLEPDSRRTQELQALLLTSRNASP